MFGMKLKEKNSIETMEELVLMMQNEIRHVNDFEKSLLQEFHEIEDIKHNLGMIMHQMINAKKLNQEREIILKKLMTETSYRNSKINIDKCKKLINMSNHIIQQLSPMISLIFNEIKKLYIEDTHVLYRESIENQKYMENVDKKTREMEIEIRKIDDEAGTHSKTLEDISKRIHQIEYDRSMRPEKRTGKIGFQS